MDEQKLADYEACLLAITDMEDSWDEEYAEDINDDLWKQGYSEALGEAASKAKATLKKWGKTGG